MKNEKIIYYAIKAVGTNPSEPVGLVRRTFTPEGRLDEALRRDLTWRRDTAIVESEYGNLSGELVEISEEEAESLIERFRQKWANG
jgi:hypothetical protein